ncbi:glycosyltransferase family 2 protein [Oscillatoria acuminata]|uniref:Putative glycosyltransferase n=1 Tax=Oscillatoria acuminata PCC 6304 TaxID=56110 RepID=K9TQZ0_9CYAN|nr:glycosyltransferase [Oscillatoria acuminata]AFY84591.1 putative glycosyltransferase [Oscillatoria acuminata PCC 6304]
MTEPQVTLVIVPRERFSCTRESLESIYQYTDIPFNLVYVDGNSPKGVRQYLEEQARLHGFNLIRVDRYLSPNKSRNIGLSQVKTKYVAFLDNDVVVSPGWLEHLINCAEETNATVVGPLMCQDKPVHEIVHFAGGESHIWTDNNGDRPRRRLREKMYKQGKRVAEVRGALQRQETELAEFHCVLVRRSIFDRLGPLDEGMLNTKEHLDFCMSVREAGETVYFEPASLVTYVPGPPLELTDLPFYMLRWSDAWQLNSLHRLRDKWNLDEDAYFQIKYKRMGWRRRKSILMPLSERLTFGIKSGFFEKRILCPLDKLLNRYLSDRYVKQQSEPIQIKPVMATETQPEEQKTPTPSLSQS